MSRETALQRFLGWIDSSTVADFDSIEDQIWYTLLGCTEERCRVEMLSTLPALLLACADDASLLAAYRANGGTWQDHDAADVREILTTTLELLPYARVVFATVPAGQRLVSGFRTNIPRPRLAREQGAT